MLVQKGIFVHTPINLLISLLRDYLLFQAIFGTFYQKLQGGFFVCLFLSAGVFIAIVLKRSYVWGVYKPNAHLLGDFSVHIMATHLIIAS